MTPNRNETYKGNWSVAVLLPAREGGEERNEKANHSDSVGKRKERTH